MSNEKQLYMGLQSSTQMPGDRQTMAEEFNYHSARWPGDEDWQRYPAFIYLFFDILKWQARANNKIPKRKHRY